MPRVTLPNNWVPRPDQLALWSYLEHGGKRAIEVAHRRWGKDDVALHFTACAAMERPATFWHMLPEYAQARKAIWTAVNPLTGKRRIDEAFPQEIRENTNDHEMFIRFRNGATWQVVGSDRYNTLVGSGTAGMVFSEWALANPQAWSYFRPMVKQNNGWALFITTPRGRNHAFKMYESAKSKPGWFAERLTARETPVFSEADLAEERGEYIEAMGDDDGDQMFAQEYLCSFDAPLVGSYYGRVLREAEEDGRIAKVPHDRAYPVHVILDIGFGDDTAMWFVQQIGIETRFIDYVSYGGFAADHGAALIQEKKYILGNVILPHDAENGNSASDKTFAAIFRRYGFKVLVLPRTANVQHDINAARNLLAVALFDKEKCAKGLECLYAYHREWDDDRKCFRDKPLHDWSSHASDALRYTAVGLPRTPWKNPIEDRYMRNRQSGTPPSWMSA